jgi:GlpG protein
MRGLSVVHRPVTITLITICVVVALATNFGTRNEPVLRALSIASYQTLVSDQQSTMIVWNHLDDIWSGQVWRLVTPIFIHFGLMHLAFNMLMLLSLGGQVESSRGPWRYLLLVLLFAIASNLGQYYLGRPILANGNIILRSSPLFGGMSGVLYGLFGYMWMKARFEPRLGLAMPNETVVILVGWFFLCLVGVIPNVANAAHGVGLLLGLLIGCAPTFWRWLRGDDQLDV